MTDIKVLIVDDSPFMRRVFSDVVDSVDSFKVLATASNGEEAVDLALTLGPDIITMDLEMPRMNGLEALQKIMAVRPTPVIMLSAVTDNGTRDTIRALQYGAIDFIRKPDGAVKLDIRQVGEQLIEKLHLAKETLTSGPLRMLPAVEDRTAEPVTRPIPPPEAAASAPSVPVAKAETAAKKPPVPEPKEAATKRSLLPEPGAARLPKAAPRAEPRRALNPLAADKAAGAGAGLPPAQPAPLPRRPKTERDPAEKTEIGKPPAKPSARAESPPAAPPETKSAGATSAFHTLVAIGTSTGGPRALHEVLTGIPENFPAPILVVQHMPPRFTNSLAQRLDSFCRIRVREATDGELVETATAYIAPGGNHMSLGKDPSGKYRIKLSREGPRNGHMPSVDVLFESLVGHSSLKRIAVLMTGMGSDGARGMKALREDGASATIAEAEQTCVVYGMPRSAVELGAASQQLPLQGIAPALVHEVQSRKS